MSEEKYEKICHDIYKYEQKLHQQNIKRIKLGLKCLFTIPWVFLALLLLTDSEKGIFLVLWIVSLFLIAIYLIYVEYLDFDIQDKMKRLNDKEYGELDALIGSEVEELEASVVETYKQMERLKDEKREAVLKKIEDHKEQLIQKKESLEERIVERKEEEGDHEEHS